MVDRMHGLLWARDYFLRTSNFFDHGRVCYLIARIAGGEPESYKRRASKMISEAKLKGQIVVADGCKLYYRFVVPNVRSEPPDAALSRQVGSTDGLGVAVPPAPTFGKEG